jgi:XapX domain-containing protein
MKFALGLVVSFAVGAACRYFDIPVGSPSVIPGALIVVAMTAGYSWTNQILNARNKVASVTHLCGGPTGESAENPGARPFSSQRIAHYPQKDRL